jgi:hypothetical protein
MADNTPDPEIKEHLRAIADSYEEIARRASQQAKGST